MAGRLWVLFGLLLFQGCATYQAAYKEPAYEAKLEPGTVMASMAYNPALVDKAMGLDPERITMKEIDEVLSNFPAPRIINLSGGFQHRSLESFSAFLVRMGYPENRVRYPRDGKLSYAGFRSSRSLAGLVGWYYEKEGMMPVLIGHSQGGVMAIKTLHELAGTFDDRPIEVWNPLRDETERRTEILDPLSGESRQIRDLKMGYASALAVGRIGRIFYGQWDMFTKLRSIPNSVREFTGFDVKGDLLGAHDVVHNENDLYQSEGLASVRNVSLHGDLSGHFSLTKTHELASDKEVWAWIDAYVPDNVPDNDLRKRIQEDWNLLFAAETWYMIKKNWCLAVQDFVRTKQAYYT